MSPTFHTNFEQIIVAYVSTHLPLYFLLRINSIAFLHIFTTEEKNHNSDIKHIMPQDQTYCFNYSVSQDKILLLFQNILTF